MEDRRLLRVGLVVAIALVLFLIWWLWPPTANSDTALVDQRSSGVSIDVLANDSDLFHRNFFIKDWSNGANGGAVTLERNGAKLVYTPPNDRSLVSDSFTYSIWTRHGFPSTASVTVTLKGAQTANAVVRPTVPAAPSNAVSDCPRGEARSSGQRTPLPKQYGKCFAFYFSWKNGGIFDEHKQTAKSLLDAVARAAAGKTILVEGFTDTSGVHHSELSRKRACSTVNALKADGLNPQAIRAFANGTADPAVATGNGVREPLNRRVEIRFVSALLQEADNSVRCGR